MKIEIPVWAMRPATAEDYEVVQAAHGKGMMQIRWPDRKALRQWTKQHAWPAPWFGFEKAFLAKMFGSPQSFTQAIADSGIEIQIPQREFILSGEKQEALDALYADRSPGGLPVGWDTLVEELREVRRAVEAGVVVQVEDGPRLQTWQGFYEWAHGRYHMLEDGADRWIGDDS